MEQAKLADKPALALSRTYPVAPEKVWHAWTDPQALRTWWAQTDAPLWRAELDVRVGGRYRSTARRSASRW